MPIADIANVEIDLSDPPLTLSDQTTPLLAATLTSDQRAALDGDVVALVTPQTWQSVMAELGILSSDAAYVALRTLFSQEGRPARALLGSREDAVAQVSRAVIANGTYTGTFTATVAGIAVTFVASSSSQDAVATGLRAAINANATLAARVTAAGSGANVDVTADYAGQPFTFDVDGYSSGQVTLSTQTASYGPADDLLAWETADPSWYFVLEDTRETPAILTYAEAIEAFSVPKVFLAQTNDADANEAASTDVGSLLQALGYYRTAIALHGSDAEWFDAALTGVCLGRPAGSINWSNRRVTGVVGAEYASTANALGKRYTLLERFRAAGISASRGGRVAQGTPLDLIIARDAIKAMMATRGLELVTSIPKLPYTDAGAQQLAEYAIRSTLLEFASDRHGVVNVDSIEIEIPSARSQSSTDRGNRHFPGINWAVTLQGAIDTFDIHGTMTA